MFVLHVKSFHFQQFLYILPEFLSANIHAGLQPCSQNGEEQLQVSRTAATETYDSILSALAPNLHVMPA